MLDTRLYLEYEAAGGTVVDSDVEIKICKLTGSVRPLEW